MTTPLQSSVLPARRTADSGVSGYLERVTAADDYTRSALSRKAKIAKLDEALAAEREGLAADIYAISQAGVSAAQIARDLDLSETHVRNSIKFQALKRAKQH